MTLGFVGLVGGLASAALFGWALCASASAADRAWREALDRGEL